MSGKDTEFLKGIRVKGGSIKIYKRSDNKYEIEIKRYFWRFKFYTKHMVVGSYEEAEDYLISTKFERHLPGSVIGMK